MARFGIDGDAVHTVGVSDFAERLKRIEIEDGHARFHIRSASAGAGDIKLAAVRIGEDVIEAALAADLGGGDDFVGLIRWRRLAEKVGSEQRDTGENEGK